MLELHPWGNDLWQPTFYLAQIVWECIGKVIVSAEQLWIGYNKCPQIYLN